jgi:hypothetical protein
MGSDLVGSYFAPSESGQETSNSDPWTRKNLKFGPWPVNVCPQNRRCLAGKGDVVVDFLHVIAIVEHA